MYGTIYIVPFFFCKLEFVEQNAKRKAQNAKCQNCVAICRGRCPHRPVPSLLEGGGTNEVSDGGSLLIAFITPSVCCRRQLPHGGSECRRGSLPLRVLKRVRQTPICQTLKNKKHPFSILRMGLFFICSV